MIVLTFENFSISRFKNFRFVPNGSYINAMDYKENELAKLLSEIIEDKERYYNYFRWHRYYSYHEVHESAETDPLCAFCAFLNDNSKRQERRTYSNFLGWWNEEKHSINDTHNYIESYRESSPYIKSFVSYREPNKVDEDDTSTPAPTVLREIGNFVKDIISYYFP